MYKIFCLSHSQKQPTQHLIVSLCIVTLFSVATTSCSQTGAAAAAESKDKIDPGVREKIQASGSLRVMVELNVPNKTGKLTPEEKQLQLEKIRAAEAAVLADLAGTPHRVVRKFDFVPSMSLEVGIVALDILERSSLVVRVYQPPTLSPLRKNEN